MITWKVFLRKLYALPVFSDEAAIRLLYREELGVRLDLETPRTFNEKMQWLKLHDRNPLYTTLVDKLAVKAWLAERIGPEHVPVAYALWNSADDIDISDLPEKFVLKTNHDCGGVVVCNDRSSFDLHAAKRKLGRCMRRNYYWSWREWPYKNVKPLVFAEEYLNPQGSGELTDYKLYCFGNGKIMTVVCEDRNSSQGLSKTYFDEDWRALDLHLGDHRVNPQHPRPAHYDRMVELAGKLAEGLPFVRVDFYESNGRLYVGELTFYPNSGFVRFNPKEWDARLGALIDLGKAYGA